MARTNTPGEAVDAVLEPLYAEYERTGVIPIPILEQIQAHAYRTGRPLTKDQVREAFVAVLSKLHKKQGYNPSKEHGKMPKLDTSKVESTEVRLPKIIVQDRTRR